MDLRKYKEAIYMYCE